MVEKETLKEKIHNLYWDYIKYPISKVITGIINIIRWFPIIWKDRDYDDFYILEILKFKLKKQAQHIKINSYHLGADNDVEKILLCVKLIDRIQEDYYTMEKFDYETSEIKWLDVEGSSDLKRMEIELIDENYEEYLNKYKLAVRRIKENPKLQIFKSELSDNANEILSMNLARYNQIRAKELLYKLLNHNMERWWT